MERKRAHITNSLMKIVRDCHRENPKSSHAALQRMLAYKGIVISDTTIAKMRRNNFNLELFNTESKADTARTKLSGPNNVGPHPRPKYNMQPYHRDPRGRKPLKEGGRMVSADFESKVLAKLDVIQNICEKTNRRVDEFKPLEMTVSPVAIERPFWDDADPKEDHISVIDRVKGLFRRDK